MSGHDERDDYDDEPWRPRATPEQLLRTPASIISAFGVIQFAFSLACLGAAVVVFVWDLVDAEVAAGDDLEWYELAAMGAVGAVVVVWNGIVIRGAARMRRCRSYRLSVLAAVLSIFPLPFYYCGPVSTPVGVWALVILMRRDVRARFAAVARGTIIPAPVETPDARAD